MGINTAITAFQPPTPLQPKLIEQLRNELRLRHYSLKTEESYVNWYKRYVHFHGVRHPAQMGGGWPPSNRCNRFAPRFGCHTSRR